MLRRKVMSWRLALAGSAILLAPGTSVPAQPPSVPPVDAPALAALGPHGVGVETLRLSYRDPSGSNRALRVVLWYPAASNTLKPGPVYSHGLAIEPGRPPLQAEFEALAAPQAPVATGRFPLVVVSHGYRGWPELMSFLTENLASKGYVVAGIDHGDAPFSDAAGFGRSFAITTATRARDQQFVIAELARRSTRGGDGVFRATDANRIGLVGYSMGGFGALATAGAGYDPMSPIHRGLPKDALSDQLGSRKADARLRAVVAFAPWGAQPPHRAWSDATLAGLRTPLLLVAGDGDDISGYREGTEWIFNHALRTQRHLLVYRDARHNIAGNPSPRIARSSFKAREYFDEPVWRTDRLNAINQHFVTAFLDRHLKLDRAGDDHLRPPPGDGSSYRGFQPRWSLGFALREAPPGE